jgi:hypothetical protein
MIPSFHAREFRSFLELHARDPTLPDDRQERTDRELSMVWDGNRDAAGIGAALHDDVTSAPTRLDESMLL